MIKGGGFKSKPTFWQLLSHNDTSGQVEQGPAAFVVERFYHALHLDQKLKEKSKVAKQKLVSTKTCAALAISIMNSGQESGDQENFAATSLATRWFTDILRRTHCNVGNVGTRKAG